MKKTMILFMGILMVNCASTNNTGVRTTIIYTPNYNIELNKDIKVDDAMEFLRSYDVRLKMRYFGTVNVRNYIHTLNELSKIGKDHGVYARFFEPGSRIHFKFNTKTNTYKAILSFWNEEIFSFQITR